jgi:hypothetical protein
VKVMALEVDEFLRRFLLHVVPRGLMRIRHFGLLANRTRRATLARCRALLGQPPPQDAQLESVVALMQRLTGIDIARCPGRGGCSSPLSSRAWPHRPIRHDVPCAPIPAEHDDRRASGRRGCASRPLASPDPPTARARGRVARRLARAVRRSRSRHAQAPRWKAPAPRPRRLTIPIASQRRSHATSSNRVYPH